MIKMETSSVLNTGWLNKAVSFTKFFTPFAGGGGGWVEARMVVSPMPTRGTTWQYRTSLCPDFF